MKRKQVAVDLMKHLVTHDWHGYSQVSRWGDGEGTCDIIIGGVGFKVEQGDRDCSSAIISAYEAAGISCGGATYTGNMRSCMCASGNFVWHPMTSGYVAQAADVYLNETNHTAMCLSADPDLLMEFSISETGGIDGVEGDQTGNESGIRGYYNYPWDGILECINTTNIDEMHTSQTAKQETTQNENTGIVFSYAVRVEGGQILPFVNNLSDYAGISGKRITDVAIKVNKGSVKYRVHVLNGHWLDYVTGCDWNDSDCGYAGCGSPIDAIEVYYYTPEDIVSQCGYQKAQYRVSPVNGKYYNWQYDNEKGANQDGYAGVFGVGIDRFQLF